MSAFLVVSDQVPLSTATIAATDNYRNGNVEDELAAVTRATTSAGAQWGNGVFRTDVGQVQYVDATAGLPAGTQWVNGLPYSGTALCTSTDAVATYSNGVPFASNGAVCVVVTA